MSGSDDGATRTPPRSRRPRLLQWWRTLSSWSWSERSAFAAALALNPGLGVLLRRRGTAAAASFVEHRSAAHYSRRRVEVTPELVRRAKRLGAIVNRAAQEPASAATCLTRSLTAQLLLRRRGIPALICIGVRPATEDDEDAESGSLLFHAWVEVADVPVNDQLDIREHYAAFPLENLGRLGNFT